MAREEVGATAQLPVPCGVLQLCMRLLHACCLRCAGPLSSQVGGPANYSYFSFWLFIAFAGWAISLGSLSALQHYENRSGLSDGPGGALLIFCNLPGMLRRLPVLLHAGRASA